MGYIYWLLSYVSVPRHKKLLHVIENYLISIYFSIKQSILQIYHFIPMKNVIYSADDMLKGDNCCD